MRVDRFDYALPRELIAQRPAARREAARLLVVADDGPPGHRGVADLPELLEPGDLLVVNDTRVLPARLHARKASGGRVELLLLEPRPAADGRPCWEALLKAARTPRPGSRLALDGGLEAELLERVGDRHVVCFDTDDARLAAHLERHGRMPLPPYIERDPGQDDREDRERYQTLFAREPGAVAAPTAGLHFGRTLLERLERRGVRRTAVTLHVGAGTFLPVRVEQAEDHVMHGERCELPPATLEAIRETRAGGGRVVAVGTTVVRTLEHFAAGGRLRSGRERTELFIRPGFRFRAVDALLTNFHLPRSTLLMLVCAFGGRERVLAAYREAVARCYRFYSYGDAMWLTRGAG